MIKQLTITWFLIVGVAVLTFTGVPRFAYSDGGDETLIHACLDNKGKPSIVGPNDVCRITETPTHWAVTALAKGLEFVLLDNLGRQVGTILDISQGQSPSILLIVKIQSRNVLLQVYPDQIHLSGTVQFEGPNCTGNPWVNPDFFGSFQSSTLASTRVVFADQSAPEGSRRELWELDDVEPTDILAFSQLAGTCNNFPGGLLRENLVPATKLEDDLHTLFPPPYSLELQ